MRNCLSLEIYSGDFVFIDIVHFLLPRRIVYLRSKRELIEAFIAEVNIDGNIADVWMDNDQAKRRYSQFSSGTIPADILYPLWKLRMDSDTSWWA